MQVYLEKPHNWTRVGNPRGANMEPVANLIWDLISQLIHTSHVAGILNIVKKIIK